MSNDSLPSAAGSQPDHLLYRTKVFANYHGETISNTEYLFPKIFEPSIHAVSEYNGIPYIHIDI